MTTLYGGPDPIDYLEGARSLGELCLKKLTKYGEKVLLV